LDGSAVYNISIRHFDEPFIVIYRYIMFLTGIVVTTYEQETGKLYFPHIFLRNKSFKIIHTA